MRTTFPLYFISKSFSLSNISRWTCDQSFVSHIAVFFCLCVTSQVHEFWACIGETCSPSVADYLITSRSKLLQTIASAWPVLLGEQEMDASATVFILVQYTVSCCSVASFLLICKPSVLRITIQIDYKSHHDTKLPHILYSTRKRVQLNSSVHNVLTFLQTSSIRLRM